MRGPGRASHLQAMAVAPRTHGPGLAQSSSGPQEVTQVLMGSGPHCAHGPKAAVPGQETLRGWGTNLPCLAWRPQC